MEETIITNTNENYAIPKITDEVFFTSAINLVAFLGVKGARYESIKEHNGSKVFQYKKTDELESLIMEYKSNKFMQAFVEELRKIKTQLHK